MTSNQLSMLITLITEISNAIEIQSKIVFGRRTSDNCPVTFNIRVLITLMQNAWLEDRAFDPDSSVKDVISDTMRQHKLPNSFVVFYLDALLNLEHLSHYGEAEQGKIIPATTKYHQLSGGSLVYLTHIRNVLVEFSHEHLQAKMLEIVEPV